MPQEGQPHGRRRYLKNPTGIAPSHLHLLPPHPLLPPVDTRRLAQNTRYHTRPSHHSTRYLERERARLAAKRTRSLHTRRQTRTTAPTAIAQVALPMMVVPAAPTTAALTAPVRAITRLTLIHPDTIPLPHPMAHPSSASSRSTAAAAAVSASSVRRLALLTASCRLSTLTRDALPIDLPHRRATMAGFPSHQIHTTLLCPHVLAPIGLSTRPRGHTHVLHPPLLLALSMPIQRAQPTHRQVQLVHQPFMIQQLRRSNPRVTTIAPCRHGQAPQQIHRCQAQCRPTPPIYQIQLMSGRVVAKEVFVRRMSAMATNCQWKERFCKCNVIEIEIRPAEQERATPTC